MCMYVYVYVYMYVCVCTDLEPVGLADALDIVHLARYVHQVGRIVPVQCAECAM